MPIPTPSLRPGDWIAGLERGLAVIEAFDEQHPRMTAAEVGQRTGITRTAARRYLLTLQHLGHVAGDGKQYWLTPRVLRLGYSYIESARLPRIVQPFLQRISQRTGEAAYLAVLDGNDAVYIARSGQHHHTNIGYVLGARLPAYLSAAGLLLIAMLEEAQQEDWLQRQHLTAFTQYTVVDKTQLREKLQHVRTQNWITVEQLMVLDFRGIAVPLRDHHGSVLGALSITMPIRQESSDYAVERVLPVLQDTAQAMRELL